MVARRTACRERPGGPDESGRGWRARRRRTDELQRADDGARVRRRRVLRPRGHRLLLELRGSASLSCGPGRRPRCDYPGRRGRAPSLRGRARHTRRSPVDRCPRTARRRRALARRRQRARGGTDRWVTASRRRSQAGATSIRTLESPPTARACASSPGTSPGCPGTAASSSWPTCRTRAPSSE